MGLDMYLYAKQHLWSFREEDKEKAEQILELFPEMVEFKKKAEGDGDMRNPINSLTAEVGYWRKANQIHHWFVNNAQNGEDDCGYYYVGREDLEKLRDLCGQVLEKPELAQELLPTASGFFFGNTEYDEYYMDDLRHTIAVIENALALPESWDFEYHSSW